MNRNAINLERLQDILKLEKTKAFSAKGGFFDLPHSIKAINIMQIHFPCLDGHKCYLRALKAMGVRYPALKAKTKLSAQC